ncbi:MAG: GNAT family N-acetyltransferase [Fibrobacteria bacterium]
MPTVSLNPHKHRFEIEAEGQVAFTVFQRSQGVIEYLHTLVPPQMEGKGIGSALAKHAMAYAKENGLKAIVTCSFINTWLKKHPEAG